MIKENRFIYRKIRNTSLIYAVTRILDNFITAQNLQCVILSQVHIEEIFKLLMRVCSDVLYYSGMLHKVHICLC